MKITSMRTFRIVASYSLVVLLGSSGFTYAGKIDFDRNAIDFTEPKIIGTPGTLHGTITSTTPTKSPRADGYEILELSYTVTRTSVGPIETVWDSSREFNHGATEDVLLSIFGNTQVTVNGGTVTLLVNGTIDGEIVTEFMSDIINPPGMHVSWNESMVKMNLSAGDHKLDLDSGIRWEGGAIGNTVTVTSIYGVSVVPIPSSLLLVSLGLLGLLGLRSDG